MDATRHMLEGIACMNKCDLPQALRHFGQAVELRATGSWQEDPQAAWVLAAAWINRSDVLRLLDRKEEAIHSLDRAIDSMSHISLENSPGCAGRLILAWINRATACGEAGKMAEALAGFSRAESLWETWGGAVSLECQLMASMLHANRARVLLDLGRAIDGWESSRTALDFLKDLEPTGPVVDASIKARGIHCHALALLLDEPGGIELAQDWIAVATDSVEETLELVRDSGYGGAWVSDLVRYGAKIYRVCQPHFLGEFIREWTATGSPLADDESLRPALEYELKLAKSELEHRVRLRPHNTDFVDRAIKVLSSLQVAEGELAANRP